MIVVISWVFGKRQNCCSWVERGMMSDQLRRPICWGKQFRMSSTTLRDPQLTVTQIPIKYKLDNLRINVASNQAFSYLPVTYKSSYQGFIVHVNLQFSLYLGSIVRLIVDSIYGRIFVTNNVQHLLIRHHFLKVPLVPIKRHVLDKP